MVTRDRWWTRKPEDEMKRTRKTIGLEEGEHEGITPVIW